MHWDEAVFERLIDAEPEPLEPFRSSTAACCSTSSSRGGDALANARVARLRQPRAACPARLPGARSAIFRTLLNAGVSRSCRPDGNGSRIRLTVDLQPNFALNQPLSPFALAAIGLLDPTRRPVRRRSTRHYALDVLSVVEATLDDPRRCSRSSSSRPAARPSPR